MTCSTSLITSYPTHFLRTVSTILALLTTIIREFFCTILPFTTAAIIILVLLVSFASICFMVAEMLGFDPSGELTKRQKRGRDVVKGETQIQNTSAVGVLKGVDERTRLRFEVQILKGLVRERCERLEDLGVVAG